MANDPLELRCSDPDAPVRRAERRAGEKAVDGFMTAAQKAAATAGNAGRHRPVRRQGREPEGDGLCRAEHRAIRSSSPRKLVRAKDIQEVMALQQEYLKSQMQAMQAQAKDLGAAATKAAMDSASRRSEIIANSTAYPEIRLRHNYFCAMQHLCCDAP